MIVGKIFKIQQESDNLCDPYVIPPLVTWELLRSLLLRILSASELPLIKQTYWAFLHVSTISFFIKTEHLLQLLLNKVYFFSVFTLVVGKSTKTQFKRENRLTWLRKFRYCFQEKSEKEKLCVFVWLVRYKLSSATDIFLKFSEVYENIYERLPLKSCRNHIFWSSLKYCY